jgi:hypothetical protein
MGRTTSLALALVIWEAVGRKTISLASITVNMESSFMTSFVLILGILGIYQNETILALKLILRFQARKVLETE